MTLSGYLLSEIKQVEKPSMAEWLETVARGESVVLDEPPEVTIRRMRDADEPRDLS